MKPSVCLKCGCSDIRRSKRHGPWEWILKRLLILPWRCMSCDNRFFRSHSGRILFTRRREISKLWCVWVTFRAALRSLSLFAILCFVLLDGSVLERAGQVASLSRDSEPTELTKVS